MPESEKQDTAAAAQSDAQQPSAEPAKKAYYSPGEVMKKKGCIGCGGMMLGTALIVIGIVASLV